MIVLNIDAEDIDELQSGAHDESDDLDYEKLSVS